MAKSLPDVVVGISTPKLLSVSVVFNITETVGDVLWWVEGWWFVLKAKALPKSTIILSYFLYTIFSTLIINLIDNIYRVLYYLIITIIYKEKRKEKIK